MNNFERALSIRPAFAYALRGTLIVKGEPEIYATLNGIAMMRTSRHAWTRHTTNALQGEAPFPAKPAVTIRTIWAPHDQNRDILTAIHLVAQTGRSVSITENNPDKTVLLDSTVFSHPEEQQLDTPHQAQAQQRITQLAQLFLNSV